MKSHPSMSFITLLVIFSLLCVNFVVGILLSVSYTRKVNQLTADVNIAVNDGMYEGEINLLVPEGLKVFVMEYQLGIIDEKDDMIQVFSQSVNSEVRRLKVSFPVRKHMQNWKISGFVNVKVKYWWIEKFMTLRF
ncbi:MAG: hypothetical protein B5M49_03915 [Thermotoga sp. 4484_232]|nr:MAG: hypothetical protein B5M49_03915 [Thermotoga sp. 4484_232]RKX56949.1 MAG: hypothetical protein DRP24_01855 [Thermotoga sp.]